MMNTKNIPIITLDGPSGTGKGTLCHMLAKHLGWNFLDSGVLYRILALAAVKRSVDLVECDKLVAIIDLLNISFISNDNLDTTVLLDNADITQELRSEQTGQNASKIATLPAVRSALLDKQRAFAKLPGLVTDGRDMGTVVFPDAILKVYLYASEEERAKRRYLQLQAKGVNVSLLQVTEELAKRDLRDTERQCSPLKPAADAVLVDTTGLTIAQVFANILQLTHEKL